MCTFNGEKYLKEQLDSILNQTYPLEELIVQDDCSTDSTVDIIKEYQREYPIIKLHVNEKNKGLNENFFSAMDKAIGDYIAIADQDDIWKLNKIEKQINMIGDHLLCFGHSRHFCIEDGITKIYEDKGSPPNYSLLRYVFVNMIAGHSMLIDSRLLNLMPFRSNLRMYDYYLGLIAATHNSIVFCNEVLCDHRIHSDNVTSANIDKRVQSPKTSFRPLKAILSSLSIRKQIKERENDFFSTTHKFIFQTKVETKETKGAKKIARLMADNSWISTVRAMIFCFFNKDKILENESSKINALIKAPFFPFLCYHFYNVLIYRQ